MKHIELFEHIKSEIDYAETTRIPSNPIFVPTEQGRLDLIQKYMLSQYRDGDHDSIGNLMVFYNIVSFPVEVASKQLDFDTKDITLIAEDERYWETWLMEKELRFWMEEKKFGTFLNQLTYNFARDGHVVTKKIDGEVELVPLKNLRFRTDALSLKDTPIIEKYAYQPDEFLSIAKERGWENYQSVELNPDKVDTGYFSKEGNKVQVFGAWFPQGYLDSDSNYFLVSYDGHILADWNEDLFYKDIKWEDMPGRLMGRGPVEKLFSEQIYLNRIANYKADGLNWTSKHFFQTRDVSFKANLLGDSDNGDVFIVNDEITPVSVEERNLAFYNAEETRWENQAQRRVFAQEALTGETAPSGTPLGSSILQAKMQAGFYDQKKEDLASYVKDIIWDWIVPEFKKENRSEHKLMMKNIMTSEKGSEKFFNLEVNHRLNKQKMAKFLPREMWDIKKALIVEQVKNSKIGIPKGFYDNLKMKMKITIIGENIDTASKIQTMQQLLNTIVPNPAVLENKIVKGILFEMMNLAGFNPMNLDLDEQPKTIQEISQGQQTKQGGSISAPVSAQGPQFNKVEQTV